MVVTTMKQLAQYQDGRLELQEVPPPMPPPGGILVRTSCSVISPGTEKMKVEQARMSLLQKARARPDQVRRVIDTARTLGWKSALEKVRNRLESPTPLGYSAAGVVVAVDEQNGRFQVGDRVACGGAECSFHAEMIAVPDLLAARIPDGLPDEKAAFTTIASISMEAVRKSGATLGERVLVLGQGIVGLLATSLLRASGARVMSADFVPARLQTARLMGAEHTVNPSRQDLEAEVRSWTAGLGVDAVLVCVGGRGSAVADSAIACLRERGVMVIVGIYDAELSWKTAYMKDIQVRYSRSYGPGRYDPGYEWGGRDYPAAHVRWTENRNFEACLQLMSTGTLDTAPLTTRHVRFEEVVPAYDTLAEEIGVVIHYGDRELPTLPASHPAALLPTSANAAARIPVPCPKIDVIGAGNFARTMLLPHLKGGPVPLGTVINATGLSARHVKEKFGFSACGTNPDEVFKNAAGAVIIGTRHHLHAPLTLKALAAGRQVFVEKPLCLNADELNDIAAAAGASQGGVMVGFNRRFAPATVRIREILAGVPGPRALAFHVFAGPLAPDHWYANVEESGGRILGEACHFFDYACHLLGRPVKVHAQALGRAGTPDSFTAQVGFEDGSSAQILYSAEGDFSFPKESLRIFASGLVLECANFQKLSVHHRRRTTVHRHDGKGHAEEMKAWLAFLQGSAPHPLPLNESLQSMALTFAALASIREGRSISLAA
jgi:predicted dehydrogenase/threonine dehydrogenase-like Zn-dependent dehydrogenase